MTTRAYDHYVDAFLRSAEARLDRAIAAVWLRFDTAYRRDGLSEAEILEKAVLFQAEALEARAAAFDEICGIIDEASLGRERSTVGIEQVSTARH